MKNNITELVFILDKSGSMAGFEKHTVGGFNATLEQQRKQEGYVYVSTVLFSNESERLHDRVDIHHLRPMMRDEYRPGGCTALMDAIGDTILHIQNIHKYARPEDIPDHTVFVIITDGMENASIRYSSGTVKGMVKEQSEKGWEFLFLAANIDAVETAETIGIRKERAGNYRQTADGMDKSYRAVSRAIQSVMCGCAKEMKLSDCLEAEEGE